MNKWIRIVEPKDALLRVGVFQCPNCKKNVIAFAEDDVDAQPRISNYTFCPHCGLKVKTET